MCEPHAEAWQQHQEAQLAASKRVSAAIKHLLRSVVIASRAQQAVALPLAPLDDVDVYARLEEQRRAEEHLYVVFPAGRQGFARGCLNRSRARANCWAKSTISGILLGPATGKQGAVGHERRHRLFAYAWCLYARDRSTDTCPLSSSCPAPLLPFLYVYPL